MPIGPTGKSINLMYGERIPYKILFRLCALNQKPSHNTHVKACLGHSDVSLYPVAIICHMLCPNSKSSRAVNSKQTRKQKEAKP